MGANIANGSCRQVEAKRANAGLRHECPNLPFVRESDHGSRSNDRQQYAMKPAGNDHVDASIKLEQL